MSKGFVKLLHPPVSICSVIHRLHKILRSGSSKRAPAPPSIVRPRKLLGLIAPLWFMRWAESPIWPGAHTEGRWSDRKGTRDISRTNRYATYRWQSAVYLTNSFVSRICGAPHSSLYDFYLQIAPLRSVDSKELQRSGRLCRLPEQSCGVEWIRAGP